MAIVTGHDQDEVQEIFEDIQALGVKEFGTKWLRASEAAVRAALEVNFDYVRNRHVVANIVYEILSSCLKDNSADNADDRR